MESGRRGFLKAVGTSALVGAAAGQSSFAADANSKVTVGVIGPGGMGSSHVRNLASRDDVNLAYVCDVDENRMGRAADLVVAAKKPRPKMTSDLRKVLEDPTIDAVFIATPDHWHAPAAILALDAGKHVYVEKPCCHNIREGRLMSDAVQRSGKCLQVGTQSRSTEFIHDAITRLHGGAIGEILVAKAWNSQRRATIGKTKPSEPPKELDYDTWVGPAPMVPFRRNMLPGIWRWWHDFGCGDIGNDGVHDIDVALWGLNPKTHPERVACLGGKYFFDDDQQFPDTQYACCEYEPDPKTGHRRQFIFEQRIWTPYTQEGYENGAAFYGTNGLMVLGHTRGWKLYGPRNKLIAERTGQVDLPAHHTNFLNCVRGSETKLNADITAGHLSATIVHLANIAARTQRVLNFNPKSERIRDDAEADALVSRKYRQEHWSVPKGV
ncbi:MAG: Gfo/Idh/MocA family oxidoreductase [Planctomycetota bacterium]|nr:Gfo/Idh/MocA family oxidoreductase [Planctomycetota bacterium]